MFDNIKMKRRMKFEATISCGGCDWDEYKEMSDSAYISIARGLCHKYGLELKSFKSDTFRNCTIKIIATKSELLEFTAAFAAECGCYITRVRV